MPFNKTYSNEDCVDACTSCMTTCAWCADKCIEDGGMEDIVRACLACVQICQTTAVLVASNSPFADRIAEFCALICDACATECERYDNDFCRACAEACRKCAEECRYASDFMETDGKDRPVREQQTGGAFIGN